MRSLPTTNASYYNRQTSPYLDGTGAKKLTFFDNILLSPTSNSRSSSGPLTSFRQRYFLPFRERFPFIGRTQHRFQREREREEPKIISCASPLRGASPTKTRSSSGGSNTNLFNYLFNRGNNRQQLFPVSPSTILSPSKKKSSSLNSSPTRSSALRNLFRGNRKSVTFSSTSPQPQEDYVDFVKPSAMDWKQNISTDHTDIAYREAVSRLRSILSPRPRSAQAGSPSRSRDNLQNSPITKSSFAHNDSPPLKRDRLSSGLRALFSNDQKELGRSSTFPVNYSSSKPYSNDGLFQGHTPSSGQDDIFNFIEKQAAYIAQLEKESNYSKNELGAMLNHVRQIISENEQLHERQKQDLFSSMIQQLNEKTDDLARGPLKIGSDPDAKLSKSQQVIRDSRVAELEAQLNQTKRALRSAQEEILDCRRGLAGNNSDLKSAGVPTKMLVDNLQASICEEHSAKIESLIREKEDLMATMTKFKEQIGELRDRETEATKKVKSSLEIVEQMQMEKSQSDLETRRVKDELDRHQQRVRELIQDHSRKLYEEKLQVENKYRQELDVLNNEMNQELDSLTKARLDLERQKRVESELRRELQQRMITIEDLRQEMHIKMSHLQGELNLALSQKSKGEQDLINSRLQLEKLERDSKHEISRLHSEINGLRKRSEDSDADLQKCQEVIAKLNENISNMQHENSLARLRLEERGVAVPSGEGTTNTGDVVSLIQVMEDKHSREMTELEQLVHVQNNLLDKLRGECKLLTDKLEQTSQQYKREKQMFQSDKERLTHTNKLTTDKHKELEFKVQSYKSSHDQMTERIHRLEDDDKARSDRIFQLLSKQSGLLKENQNLQNEVALLKCKSGRDDEDSKPSFRTSRMH